MYSIKIFTLRFRLCNIIIAIAQLFNSAEMVKFQTLKWWLGVIKIMPGLLLVFPGDPYRIGDLCHLFTLFKFFEKILFRLHDVRLADIETAPRTVQIALGLAAKLNVHFGMPVRC